MSKLDHDPRQDDSLILDRIGVLAAQGKPCESPQEMAAQTGIPEDRVKRSYLRLHRAGFGVPTPAATPDELRTRWRRPRAHCNRWPRHKPSMSRTQPKAATSGHQRMP